MIRDPFRLPYEATGFSGPPFADKDEMTVTWDDLIKAVVTVGRWKEDLSPHGVFSFAEATHRATCLRAYLETRDDRLHHSPAFRGLDPTEQGVVSYYLGMATTKLFADRCLGVPWLMHVSRYGAAWSITYSGPRRPDLFGADTAGNWTVAEAKGRVRMRQSLITAMQAQKNAVATINQCAPRFRIGVATRFPQRQLEARVVDPPPRRTADALALDASDWLAAYYAPIVDLIAQNPDVYGTRQRGTLYGALPGADVEIGLRANVYRHLRSRPLVPPETSPPRRTKATSRDQGTSPLSQQTDDRSERWLNRLLELLAARGQPERPADGVYVRLGSRWFN
jgi:hypothetical protein